MSRSVWTTVSVTRAMSDGGHAGAAPSGAARTAYWQGSQVPSSRAQERRRLFQQGMDLAKARLEANPDDPEGLFWLAVHTGAEALERGRLQALPALPVMEGLLLRCHAIDPTYEQAGPARILGRLYDQAPALISLGSTVKARRWLESALALAGDFPGNLAFAADFFVRHGERARARHLAEACRALLVGAAAARTLGPDEPEWRAIVDRILGQVPPSPARGAP